MSTRKREHNRMLRMYARMYTRMEGVSLAECWYCGDVREALDYCPPINQVELIDIEDFRRLGHGFHLVPCCGECAQRLPRSALLTPVERLHHLHASYSRAIDKWYSGWTKDEIDELGPTLRREVLAKQRIVGVWVDKLRSIEARMLSL